MNTRRSQPSPRLQAAHASNTAPGRADRFRRRRCRPALLTRPARGGCRRRLDAERVGPGPVDAGRRHACQQRARRTERHQGAGVRRLWHLHRLLEQHRRGGPRAEQGARAGNRLARHRHRMVGTDAGRIQGDFRWPAPVAKPGRIAARRAGKHASTAWPGPRVAGGSREPERHLAAIAHLAGCHPRFAAPASALSARHSFERGHGRHGGAGARARFPLGSGHDGRTAQASPRRRRNSLRPRSKATRFPATTSTSPITASVDQR